jgi:hypothetical protein
MRALLSSIIGLVWIGASACTDEPDGKTASAGKDKLCALAGAQFDATSDSCRCPNGGSWNGRGCDAAPPPAATELAAKPLHDAVAEQPAAQAVEAPKTDEHEHVDEHEHADGHETKLAAVEPVPKEEAGEVSMGEGTSDAGVAGDRSAHMAEVRARLKRDCREAGAYWLDDDRACFCPHGAVLVGAACRHLVGRLTDDVCEGVQAPGKWRQGRCECPTGLTFAPSRGGCVAPHEGSVAVLRRACESSLNGGRWNARSARCDCPGGKVNVGENCEVQERLSSREVCESATNKGTWDKDGKRCACGAGRFWIDQQCKSFAHVTASEACESEANRGRWESRLLRCICPRLTKWDATRRTCL